MNAKTGWILSLLLWPCIAVSEPCERHWDAFLVKPDSQSLMLLQQAIGNAVQGCDWGRPGNAGLVPTIDQDRRLFALISNGNEYAFRAALLVAPCFDGGELGELNRVAGMFLDGHPSIFVRIISEKALQVVQFKSFLTTQPAQAVDDIDRMMDVIDHRIKLLRAVSDPSLEEIKERSLSVLSEHKQTLNTIMMDMNKAE